MSVCYWLLIAVFTDAVPLLLNRKSTDFVGVNLYVDDNGMLKNLKQNDRASSVCFAGLLSACNPFISRQAYASSWRCLPWSLS